MKITQEDMDAINKNVEMMPFKKFAQANSAIYCEETFMLQGVFKEKRTGKVIKGDNFIAHRLAGLSVEEVYKIYLRWFNHTRTKYEEEREFVSAKEGI